jgi:hypothetical protein
MNIKKLICCLLIILSLNDIYNKLEKTLNTFSEIEKVKNNIIKSYATIVNYKTKEKNRELNYEHNSWDGISLE